MKIHKIAGYMAGYAAGRILSKAAARWTASLLDQIDEALNDLDLGDSSDEVEPQGCVCGSAEHTTGRLVTVGVPALLDNAEHGVLPLMATFAYYSHDPVALSMTLTVDVVCENGHIGSDHETWGFALDLLDTALSKDGNSLTGEGDVTIQYDDATEDGLTFWLKDTYEVAHAVNILDVEPLREFMTAALVVREELGEHVIDREIESLLDGTWEA